MKFNSINEEYFKRMNVISSLMVTNPIFDEKTKIEIRNMQSTFNKYISPRQSTGETISITTDEALANLTDKMNNDLSKLSLKSWKKLQEFCWSVRKIKALDNTYPEVKIKIEDLIKCSLKVYKKTNKQIYLMAKEMIESDKFLIYFNDLGINSFYDCTYLDRKIIACENKDYNSYSSFIHELQHGIDKEMFYDRAYFFTELSPIFFEIIMCDYLNKKGSYEGLYDKRINNFNDLLKEIYAYTRILKNFDRNERKLTVENYKSILGVENVEKLAEFYNECYYDDFNVSVKYVLSFLKSLEIRRLYYQNKKAAIKKLKDIIIGVDNEVKLSKLKKEYDIFINEIEKLYIKKCPRRF